MILQYSLDVLSVLEGTCVRSDAATESSMQVQLSSVTSSGK